MQDFNRNIFQAQQAQLQNAKKKPTKIKSFCRYDLISQHISISNIDFAERIINGVSLIVFKPCNLNLEESGPGSKSSDKIKTVIHPIDIKGGLFAYKELKVLMKIRKNKKNK